MARHLSLAEVIALHQQILEMMGSSSQGLRDESSLESAIMRARMAEHYEGADLVRQAVLMGVGISQAQAFVDGNKRTAFIVMDTFLSVNDQEFVGEPMELVRMLELIAERPGERDAATDDFEAWLRERVAASQR